MAIAFLDRVGYVAWVVRFALRFVFVGRGIHIANFGFMMKVGFVYGLTRVASWLFVNNALVVVLLLDVGGYWWAGVVGFVFLCAFEYCVVVLVVVIVDVVSLQLRFLGLCIGGFWCT